MSPRQPTLKSNVHTSLLVKSSILQKCALISVERYLYLHVSCTIRPVLTIFVTFRYLVRLTAYIYIYYNLTGTRKYHWTVSAVAMRMSKYRRLPQKGHFVVLQKRTPLCDPWEERDESVPLSRKCTGPPWGKRECFQSLPVKSAENIVFYLPKTNHLRPIVMARANFQVEALQVVRNVIFQESGQKVCDVSRSSAIRHPC